MASEPGHVQITEFNKEAIPQVNWMMEDLFCRYGVSIPYFMLDFDFPDYSERPDWVSGYNFNLDWGAWGYWLVWFNNLLGLLFDTAKLPRWQMPDLSPGSWAMFNSKTSELYEEREARIFVHTWNTDHNEVKRCTRNGAFTRVRTVSAIRDAANQVCADVDNNVYLIDSDTDKIYKYKKDGTLLVTKEIDGAAAITAGPDGYIYELGFDGLNQRILKRNASDLTVDGTMTGVDVLNSTGLACDGNGYLYTHNSDTGKIEKWDFDSATKVASRTPPIGGYALSVAGTLLGGMTWGANHAFTMSTALDEDGTTWDLDEISKLRDMAAINGNFLFIGYNSGDSNERAAKYTAARLNIWNITVGGADFNVTGIAAYPF